MLGTDEKEREGKGEGEEGREGGLSRRNAQDMLLTGCKGQG